MNDVYPLNELYHHGILGQKWGVRRFQNKDGSLTSAGKKRYEQTGIGAPKNTKLDKSTRQANPSIRSDASGNRAGEVNPALVAVVSQTATMAAMLGAMKLKQHHEIKKFDAEIDTMYTNRDIKSLQDAPKLKVPMSASESMKVVNPGFPAFGKTENCMLCTTAMVMREKGYDVKAQTITHGLYKQNVENMFDNGGKFSRIKARKTTDIVNKLNTEGDGAYGNLMITWKLGGGHSVFWKNEGGSTHIYDGQSGQEYDLKNPQTSKFLKTISPMGSQYSRLDKAVPNERVLALLTKK